MGRISGYSFSGIYYISYRLDATLTTNVNDLCMCIDSSNNVGADSTVYERKIQKNSLYIGVDLLWSAGAVFVMSDEGECVCCAGVEW